MAHMDWQHRCEPPTWQPTAGTVRPVFATICTPCAEACHAQHEPRQHRGGQPCKAPDQQQGSRHSTAHTTLLHPLSRRAMPNVVLCTMAAHTSAQQSCERHRSTRSACSLSACIHTCGQHTHLPHRPSACCCRAGTCAVSARGHACQAVSCLVATEALCSTAQVAVSSGRALLC